MTAHGTTHGHVIHWARLYDLGTGVLGRKVRALHRDVLRAAAIAAGERVLDVGCGPGRLTIAAALAAGASGEVLGIDPAPEMIALATKKAARAGSSARFRVAGAEALPAPDGSFDVAVTNLVLHHLSPEHQRRGLAEIFRVLAPGGRFVAGDISAIPGHRLGHLLSVVGLRRGAGHAEHLRALFEAAGFEAVLVEPATARSFCVLRARKPGRPTDAGKAP